jgi:hypothetical protein
MQIEVEGGKPYVGFDHHTQIDQGSDRRESRKLASALAPGLVLT